MDMNDPRIANLRRAAGITRQQGNAIMSQLDQMTDEQVNSMLDQNDDLRDFISIGADGNNGGYVVNYAEQPQNKKEETISFQAPWEGNLSSVQNGGPQIMGGFYQQNNLFGNFWMQQSDPRVQEYNKHPGMRLYNINPYAFYDAQMLLDFYNHLEEERANQENLTYMFASLGARLNDNSQELVDYAEQFKFKPADQIVQEQIEARQKAEEEKRKELYHEDGSPKTVYDVYDSNGYRFQKVSGFTFECITTGEVLIDYKPRKDENGQSYEIHTLTEDRQKAYKEQQIRMAAAYAARFDEMFARLFNADYFGNIAKWESWHREGLSDSEIAKRYEDERVDWKKHEAIINRALMSASYSREKFHDILAKCCHCDLDYANKSDFFSLSYDFERDLHYKSLISTPEEMENDPLVHTKLQQEYEIKRKMFMDKVNSGNLGCDMMMDAHYHPTFPKPNIDSLTLEDFNKPENHVMYTQIVTPHLATPNLFIPDNTQSQQPSREELARLGVNLDENGQPIPSERTVGFMTVDDDTGEVLSQQEFKVPIDGQQCASASDDMTDDELSKLF